MYCINTGYKRWGLVSGGSLQPKDEPQEIQKYTEQRLEKTIMAIIRGKNILFNFFILYVFLHQSASSPTLTCYKIPPSNNPGSPTLTAYRKRFSFVLKSSNDSTSITRIKSTGSAISANCPWQLAIDDNLNRFPRIIVYAKCDNCDKNVCKPVKFSHKVLYEKCDYKTGEQVWKWTSEELNVAFVYTKKV